MSARLQSTGELRKKQPLCPTNPAIADIWYNFGYALRVQRPFAEAFDAYGKALDHGVSQPEEVYPKRSAIRTEQFDALDGALGRARCKLLKDRKIVTILSDAAKLGLVVSATTRYMAHATLKRAIQRHLQDPLADMLLRSEVPDGSTGQVEEGDGALALKAG